MVKIRKIIYFWALSFCILSVHGQTIGFSYDTNGNMIPKNNSGSFDKQAVLSAKAFLGGAYNTSTNLMSDHCAFLAYCPQEPYTGGMSGFTHIGGGGETTTPSVLAITGNNAEVDWVFTELHEAKDIWAKRHTKQVELSRMTKHTIKMRFYHSSVKAYRIVGRF